MKFKKSKILWILLVLLFAFSLPLAAEPAEEGEESDWTVEEYNEEAFTAKEEGMAGYDPLSPDAPGLAATAAILVDADTGQVLYELAPDEQRFPASLTKLMTLVVILDALEQGTVTLEDEVVFSEAAVNQESSFLEMEVGETRTLKNCLEVMMVFSANDAAFALAEHVGGSVEGFAAMMNDKAKALGMDATNFKNPNGLPDPEHWTTARDLATLSCYCVSREDVMAYTSLEYVELEDGKKIYNTNKLMFWCDGVDGLKTGRTNAAGHCLAATAERDGMRLVSVTLGSEEDYYHLVDGMRLLEYGFANYTHENVVTKGESFGDITALYGREDTVSVIASEDIFYTVKNGESLTCEVVPTLLESVEGPADAGIYSGEVVVTLDGAEIGRCDLVTGEEIKKRTVWQWLADFFSALIKSI
ncbi:MAG: D-alanyl-D-alanine carboxypeptidase [Firmicutes bacterium]|nr:D-alanyl-D-alanine carboxypeptidase [Bacillota bacterium]